MNKSDIFSLSFLFDIRVCLYYFDQYDAICGHGSLSKRSKKKKRGSKKNRRGEQPQNYIVSCINHPFFPSIDSHESMKITICLLISLLIIKVQSSSYVYTYDHDTDDDDDEQCCLVRLGEQFCLAKPLTRSLIQVKKDCQRIEANDKKKDYLKKIVRRLNAVQSDKIGEKILIQLKDPLEKNILDNDLLCLSTTTNNIDLEKCYVKLPKKKEKPKKSGE